VAVEKPRPDVVHRHVGPVAGVAAGRRRDVSVLHRGAVRLFVQPAGRLVLPAERPGPSGHRGRGGRLGLGIHHPGFRLVLLAPDRAQDDQRRKEKDAVSTPRAGGHGNLR
jgi:hypothetical protein